MAAAKKAAKSAGVTVPKRKTISRSAKSGKIVSSEEAKLSPATTVTETIEVPTKLKVPKNFGAAADLLYDVREQRLILQKKVDELKNFETKVKQHLIDNMSKKDSTGAAGRIARAQIVSEPKPAVEDWDSFYGHIKKTGQFDLLNRAPNASAIKARWDAGKKIPGIGSFNVTKVSVTKL